MLNHKMSYEHEWNLMELLINLFCSNVQWKQLMSISNVIYLYVHIYRISILIEHKGKSPYIHKATITEYSWRCKLFAKLILHFHASLEMNFSITLQLQSFSTFFTYFIVFIREENMIDFNGFTKLCIFTLDKVSLDCKIEWCSVFT